MKLLKLIQLILIGLFSLPSLLQAQTIPLDKFLDQLKREHPLFEKERLTAQIEKEERNSFLGDQDWNLFSSMNFLHEEPAIAFAGPERTNALSVNGGVERVFWKTGGRLSATFSASRADIKLDPAFAGFGFPNSFYQNELAITYMHPLMKNRKGFLDRLQYDLKKFDIDFSEVQALENQEDFLAGVAGKFLDWVFLTEQKKIIQDRLKLSEEELSRTRRKREANLVDQVDVIRAQDAVRIAKQNQVLIESHWKGLQAELAELSQNNELYNVSPEFNLYELQDFVPLKEATAELKENSRLIRTLNVRLNQLDYARRGFEETLKPDLALVVQFNTKKLDEGFGSSLKMDKPNAIVGLHFSVPIRNRTARSQIAKTDLQVNQLKKQLGDLTLSLTSALANLHIQIREFEQVLQLNVEQMQSAKEKTLEELKLYNQGRGDLTFVIQSQDNEENAKLTYAGNALTYHKLIIEYRALMDQLYDYD